MISRSFPPVNLIPTPSGNQDKRYPSPHALSYDENWTKWFAPNMRHSTPVLALHSPYLIERGKFAHEARYYLLSKFTYPRMCQRSSSQLGVPVRQPEQHPPVPDELVSRDIHPIAPLGREGLHSPGSAALCHRTSSVRRTRTCTTWNTRGLTGSGESSRRYVRSPCASLAGGLYVRSFFYEAWLISHIVLSSSWSCRAGTTPTTSTPCSEGTCSRCPIRSGPRQTRVLLLPGSQPHAAMGESSFFHHAHSAGERGVFVVVTRDPGVAPFQALRLDRR